MPKPLDFAELQHQPEQEGRASHADIYGWGLRAAGLGQVQIEQARAVMTKRRKALRQLAKS